MHCTSADVRKKRRLGNTNTSSKNGECLLRVGALDSPALALKEQGAQLSPINAGPTPKANQQPGALYV